MRLKKYLAILLTLLLILPIITAFPIQASASPEAIANLSTYKQYFRRTIGSFARADMVESNILASVTVAQAILETGWGQSIKTDLPEIGKNLFGIRTYSDWGGNIYDAENNIICSNLIEFGIIDGADYTGWGWRAYDSWADSIADHGDLLNTSRYAVIPGMTDYKAICHALMECGYTYDVGYDVDLIAAIENFDLTVYDDITANDSGVIAIRMSDTEKVLALDGSCTLTAEILPATVTQPLTWASDNTAVATVDQNGVVTAVAAGITLITASIGNREACCIVTVKSGAISYNAKVINVTTQLNIRDQASASGTVIGQFSNGQMINVTGEAVNGWYPVTSVNSLGEPISGWSSAEYITLLPVIVDENIIKVGLNRFEINRDVGKTYQFKHAVGSTYPIDKTLTWSSSDPTVASVNESGLVTMLKYGTTTVTATAIGGASASCVVNVTTAQVKYIAHTATQLNVRVDDIASAKWIGYLAPKRDSGADIIITDNYYNSDGLIDDAWQFFEGTMISGETATAYANADFIVISEKVTAPPPDSNFTFTDATFAIKEGYLYGAAPGCTIGELLAHVSDANSVVYDKNGLVLTTESVLTTGATLNILTDNIVTSSVTIIIRGDINCDGQINPTDYLFLRRYLLGTITIDGLGLKAAYVSGSSNISVVDYIMIKRQYLGTYTIVQNPIV